MIDLVHASNEASILVDSCCPSDSFGRVTQRFAQAGATNTTAVGANWPSDPQELFTWLTVATDHARDVWNGPKETDSFDVGLTHISFPSQNIDEFTDAYRALRFIEESGLPLSIHGLSPITVTQKTFVKAAERISAVASNEGIGLILRARDPKLVEHFLTRSCLASLNDSQLRTLYSAAWNAFNEALERIRICPERRGREDEWWERRFGFATVLLARLVPRLDDSEIDTVAKTTLPLSGCSGIWDRFSVVRSLRILLERVGSPDC